MDEGIPLVHDGRSELRETVDDPVNRVLIARDERRRQNNGVLGPDADRMVTVGDPRQDRHRLALRAGADKHALVVRHRIEILNRHDRSARHLQVAEVAGNPHVADHRAPDEGNLAAVEPRHLDNLLDSVHVGGEGRQDDAALGSKEHGVEDRDDVALARDEARNLGVRAVDEQEIDARVAEAREPIEIGDPAVERNLIHLEVTGVQHHPGRRRDRDRHCVRDRVVHREEFDRERPESLDLARHHVKGDRLDPMLLELRLEEGEGEPGSEERDVLAKAEQVGHGADVVLVAMGEDDRLNIVKPVLDRAEIGEDEIDTGLGLLGKQDTAVDDEEPATELEDGHVAADLTEAAESEDPQGPGCELGGSGEFAVDHAANPRTSPAARSRRRTARWSSVASTSGKRTGPPGSPCSPSAAFTVITPCVRNTPV
ncbi:unannotated protein [freshwater metagenome]|uniref:Unannotated protein n=1 Tax=freshwater metagenome TaxID=449393 RepID=A0A6J6S9Q8_9ZZZZ